MRMDPLILQAYEVYWKQTSDMVFIKDIHGVYYAASQAFAAAAGHESAEALIGKTDLEVFASAELAGRYMEDDARLLALGAPLIDYIEPFTSADGVPRYCLTSKYILRGEGGEAVAILGISRDITAEYQARQVYENELKVLFELPPDARIAVLFDVTDWRVVDVRIRDGSDQAALRCERIDDYVRQSVEGIVEDEAARSFFAGFSAEFLAAEYAGGMRRREFEHLRRMPDGTECWVREELHLLLDPVNGHLSLIGILHDIDATRRAQERLVEAAERDSMTGLYNHDATVKRIVRYLAEASGEQALFMIDLDNFKQVNDSFGHQYGDSIITNVGAAIRSAFRSTDIIGRMGGDEFMVLMKDVSNETLVRRRAEALIAALQFSASDGSRELALTTSIGITLFTPGEVDFDALYKEVDSALYQSKRGGKNRYTIFGRNGGHGQQSDEPGMMALESVSTVQLKTLLSYMDGGVVMAEVDDDIHVTYVSPSFYRSFRRSPEESADRPEGVMAHVFAEDLPGLRTEIMKTAESDALLDFTYRVAYEDGVEWRRIRAKRIPEMQNGKRCVVAVLTDITEFMRANEHLRETQERYRTAVEQTDAMLWEVDIASRTLRLTGPAWDRYQYVSRVFPDAPESYLQTGIVCPESAEQFRRMFSDMFAGEEGGSYFILHDRKNIGRLWVKQQFRLLRDGNGAPYCALGIAQPVPNIDAEMHGFEHESRFADVVRDSLLGYVRGNLSQNRLEYGWMRGDTGYERYSGAEYDAYHNDACEAYVHAEDIAEFALVTSREYLLARFREGESWRFVDYRRKSPDGAYRWASLFIKLMRHPISGDVYAFSYFRDNEVRKNWALSMGKPLTRNAALLLYSQDSMEALSEHILSISPGENLVAVAVIEMLGVDRIRNEMGEQEVRELLFTFGRLCRIAISGNIVIGQLSENRISLLHVDAGSVEAQHEHISNTMTMLKSLLRQSHPEADVSLVGGFAVERADQTTYSQLLRKADIACRSAAQTLGESAVEYADTGLPAADGGAPDLVERYRALEMRYQQQANMLRVSENDPLTDILGKQAFFCRVSEILSAEPNRKLMIIRFDINRFKVYNDVRGTTAGDRLLCDIASMLRHSGDFALLCARLESDHFAVLARDDANEVERFVRSLEKWLSDYASDFRLSATVGAYRITDTSVDISLMCDRALLALRSVKSGFDTKLAYYNYTLRYRLIDEQQLVGDMEAALKNEQFLLYFQPQVNYESGMLAGAEALVRWNHPKRGLLPPSVFIPLFEKNGLITRLDEYVWDRCCRYMQDWLTRYPQSASLSLSVSVNVSRIDIYDDRLAETLKRLVRKYALPPSALRLEITESAYMENPQQLIDTVRQLQAAGFKVEMDDFGSGYSSLNTLKDVSVDVLKLDMKFLEDCVDSARGGNILSSIIRMAHWLKLPIIAEGVETKPQADYLKSLGCVYMQGYFFDRPMPAQRFERLLADGAVSYAEQYKDTSVEGVAAFWDPSAQMALLFNSFVGGAAIMEYRNGILEASRVNDNFYKTLGTTREQYLPVQNDLLACFNPENRAKVVREIEAAIETGEERDYELETLQGMGGVTRPWQYSRIRLLAKNDDSAILYLAIEDITDRKRLEFEQAAEKERNRLLMQSTGLVFFDYDVDADVFTYQMYLPETGVTQHVTPQFFDRIKASKRMDESSALALRTAIQETMDSPGSGEIELRTNLWNTGMRWGRARYVPIMDASGRVYRLIGQINDIQDVKDRAAISEAIRRKLNANTATYSLNDDVIEQMLGLFYGASDVCTAVETALSFLGEYYDVSRAYIFEDIAEHTAFCNTFEWCAPDIVPQKDMLQRVDYRDIGGREQYIARFDGSGVYYCPDVQALSEGEREILEPQGIRSMLHYAVWENGVFSGIIGFDECRENRRWTDEQMGTLRFVSRIIATYLLKMRQSDNAAFSADFRAALDDNAEYIYIIDPDTYEIIYINKAVWQHSGKELIGGLCYREFIGRSEPCLQCPVPHMYSTDKLRLAEVTRADGMVVLSHASPVRWNGRSMAMMSCVDVTERKGKSE